MFKRFSLLSFLFPVILAATPVFSVHAEELVAPKQAAETSAAKPAAISKTSDDSKATKATKAIKADLVKGEQIAGQTCLACHNADGNSTISTNPKLAGQHVEYLYKQLKNFKSIDGKPAERTSAIMAGMVAALSDEDMKNVAAFYASKTLKGDVSKTKAEFGGKIYRIGHFSSMIPACSGCHGPTGAGMPAQYPRIGGQSADYIEAQLKAFRSGERKNDANSAMRNVAIRMSDKEIKEVADYVAGLR